MDSTCLGRIGFINIIKSASKSLYLSYLDVAETRFMPQNILTSNNKNKKNRSQSRDFIANKAMNDYHRKEVIDSIIILLKSSKNNLKHLIIGHNNLNYDECKIICKFASIRGLITLDLFGNNINTNQLIDIHNIIFKNRKKLLINEIKKKKDIPNCICLIIVEYAIHDSQSLYRCSNWKPRHSPKSYG